MLDMLALIAASALLCAFAKSPPLAVPVLLIVLPACWILLLVTAPQGDHSLDVTERWPFFLIGRTWLLTVTAVLLFLSARAFFT